MTMALNKSQLKYLRGICHHINPVVMIGQKGLTENVMNEIDQALDQHELIKVKLRSDASNRKVWITTIVDNLSAEQVMSIGQVACFYRKHPENPELELPR